MYRRARLRAAAIVLGGDDGDMRRGSSPEVGPRTLNRIEPRPYSQESVLDDVIRISVVANENEGQSPLPTSTRAIEVLEARESHFGVASMRLRCGLALGVTQHTPLSRHEPLRFHEISLQRQGATMHARSTWLIPAWPNVSTAETVLVSQPDMLGCSGDVDRWGLATPPSPIRTPGTLASWMTKGSLRACATIEVTRVDVLGTQLFRVFVDGAVVGVLETGGGLSRSVEPGIHDVRVEQRWFSSRLMRMDLSPGETARYVCSRPPGLLGFSYSLVRRNRSLLLSRRDRKVSSW